MYSYKKIFRHRCSKCGKRHSWYINVSIWIKIINCVFAMRIGSRIKKVKIVINRKPWLAHNYQFKALDFILSNPRSALFLDPGLGKTSIMLSLLRIKKFQNKSKKTLIIAPLTVAKNTWPDEIAKWSNFKNLQEFVIHGKTKNEFLKAKNIDIFLINPEGLKWMHSYLYSMLSKGAKNPFDTLIIDESSLFKSHKSKRFQYLVDMAPLFKRSHILTGTPSPNSYLDLWSQIYLLDGGKSLGKNYYKFRNAHFERNSYNEYDWKLKDFHEEIIVDKISHLVLNMSAKDHLKLPPLITNKIPIRLSKSNMKIYKKLERDLLIKLEDSTISADSQMLLSGKCHQFANGSIYEDIPIDLDDAEIAEFKKTRKTILVHEEKLNVLKNISDELRGKPLLISYNFKHDLEALRRLYGKDLPYIGSGVSEKEVKNIKTKWNNGELPFLAIQPKSAAYGLNLQESGNDIFLFSLQWSLEKHIQLIGRIHRQGVKGKEVRVHTPYCLDTIDELILLKLENKDYKQKTLRELFNLR